LDVHRDELARVGKPFPRVLPIFKEIYCAKDRATALAMAGPHLGGKYKAYASWGQGEAMPAEEDIRQPFESLLEDRFVLGSPEECYEQLKPCWEKVGAPALVLRTHWIGMPAAHALDSMRLISDELPRLARCGRRLTRPPSRRQMSFLTRSNAARQGFGKPVPRKEDARLVAGRGRYSDDFSLPGQAQAQLVRSPHAHARVLGIDVTAALAVPGVIAVLTGTDAEADGLKPIPHKPVPTNPNEFPLGGRDGSKSSSPRIPCWSRTSRASWGAGGHGDRGDGGGGRGCGGACGGRLRAAPLGDGDPRGGRGGGARALEGGGLQCLRRLGRRRRARHRCRLRPRRAHRPP
jgi:hypothetical protein